MCWGTHLRLLFWGCTRDCDVARDVRPRSVAPNRRSSLRGKSIKLEPRAKANSWWLAIWLRYVSRNATQRRIYRFGAADVVAGAGVRYWMVGTRRGSMVAPPLRWLPDWHPSSRVMAVARRLGDSDSLPRRVDCAYRWIDRFLLLNNDVTERLRFCDDARQTGDV